MDNLEDINDSSLNKDDGDLNIDGIEEKLRASIWNTTSKVCDSEEKKLNCKITRNFKQVLGDVMYTQLQHMSKDIEAFSGHARRSTITSEDVKLCARRNDHLYDILNDFVASLESDKVTLGSKKTSKRN
ncbi:hypothetical protein K502DRAFT_348160 [Neoconidiobolus thromboides FSU 785]|nr:hypothetical protein K502DRAFT_348160 [Neoconidiobolus thromboides FSU 785]